MTCVEVERELLAYHFNTLEPDARAKLEAHLVECAACVAEYIALKRAVEAGDDTPAPSEAARLRLRRAVAEELGIGEKRWSWWERPLALAVAASIVLVAGAATHALATSPGTAPYALGRGQ